MRAVDATPLQKGQLFNNDSHCRGMNYPNVNSWTEKEQSIVPIIFLFQIKLATRNSYSEKHTLLELQDYKTIITPPSRLPVFLLSVSNFA